LIVRRESEVASSRFDAANRMEYPAGPFSGGPVGFEALKANFA
jgi:hypothetical protein